MLCSSHQQKPHVRHTLLQKRDVALARVINTGSNRCAIAAKKYCVVNAGGNLHVRRPSTGSGKRHGPELFMPQVTAVPSLRRSTL